jgi:hypothetical protein
MQQYYYLKGDQQIGPFSIEELGQQPINASTLVWAKHMTDWKRVADVPELSGLFPSVAPPPGQPRPPASKNLLGDQPFNAPGASGYMPKTWLVESILVTLFCCLPLGIVGIINASKVESRYRIGDVQGAQEASNEAAKWTKIGLFVSLGLFALYMLLVFLGIGSAILSNPNF